MKYLFGSISAAALLVACQTETGKPSYETTTVETVVEEALEKITLPDFTQIPDDQNAIFQAFGWADFDPATIRTEKIDGGLAVIFGYGGNILASVGADGVLIVDSQMPQLHETISEEIAKLGGDDVDYIINTHWHFDHAEGNRAFGPMGAKIISQENSRDYLQGAHDINLVQFSYPQQAYEASAVPTETFASKMNMNFNGHFIELLNFGPAHTTGDAIVWFKNANVVHMGDVANLSGFPFIDSGNGGTIDGMIYSIRETMKLLNAETIIVPGHGEISTLADLEEFVSNLEAVRDGIVALRAKGLSLEEIQSKNVASMFGEVGPMLVDRAYTGMD